MVTKPSDLTLATHSLLNEYFLNTQPFCKKVVLTKVIQFRHIPGPLYQGGKHNMFLCRMMVPTIRI